MAKGKGDSAKVGRIAMVNRDGSERKFKAWDGSTRKGKYAPFATLFGRKLNGKSMLSVALDKNLDLSKINAGEIFLNVYFEEGVELEFDIEELNSNTSGRGNKTGGRKSASQADEADDDDDNGDDPFA